MSLLSREEHRGPAHRHPAMWRTSDPVPWGPLCPGFFRHTRSPSGPVAPPHCPRGSGPCRPARRPGQSRGDAALWREQPAPLSWARATQRRTQTLRLFAWTPQWLQQRRAGDERDTRVQKQVAPDASPGGTRVLRERAPRFLWDRHGGRTERQVCQKARGLLCQGIQPTGELPLRTDGAQRSGRRLGERGRDALPTGKRGRPQQPRRPGGTGRRQQPGAQRHQRGPNRPPSQAPSPAHPDTAPPLEPKDRHAQPLEAVKPALRRRWAAERRRTNRSAQKPGRRQARGEGYGSGPHVVRVHGTTRQVPAVA